MGAGVSSLARATRTQSTWARLTKGELKWIQELASKSDSENENENEIERKNRSQRKNEKQESEPKRQMWSK